MFERMISTLMARSTIYKENGNVIIHLPDIIDLTMFQIDTYELIYDVRIGIINSDNLQVNFIEKVTFL